MHGRLHHFYHRHDSLRHRYQHHNHHHYHHHHSQQQQQKQQHHPICLSPMASESLTIDYLSVVDLKDCRQNNYGLHQLLLCYNE